MRSPADLLKTSRDWLDGHGPMAWIAAMVLGFIFVWPLGLVILFYMIGTNRMWKKNSNHSCRRHARHHGTGNTAFDTYREETLKRLEDEQNAFQNFLSNLRAAKDKAEFDQFMANRGKSDNDAPEATA